MDKSDIHSLLEDRWCPFFGALPSSGTPDGITEKCLSIIEDARRFWGSFEYSTGVSAPDPERVEKNTGFPAIWIKSARFLLHQCSTEDMLFSARHNQGGWVKGHEKSFLQVDSDQLNPRVLTNTITNRSGLPDDFKMAMIDPEDRRYIMDDGSGEQLITPAMTYALMSICVAWHLLKDIACGYETTDSKNTLSELLEANKLLGASYIWASDQKCSIEKMESAISEIKITEGKKRSSACGKKGAIPKQEEATLRYKEWNKMASELWKKHPEWKKPSIAKEIAKKMGGNANTIRRRISQEKA